MAPEPKEGISQVEAQSKNSSPKITRKDFLKALGVLGGGAALSLGGLKARDGLLEKPAQVPESDKTDRAPIRSPYYYVALQEVRKEDPTQVEIARGILENTDQQGFANLRTFVPSYDENIRIPFTKVSVNKSLNKGPVGTSSENKQKEVHVIFTGFAFPPAGHPFTAWDIVIDRVFGSIPKVLASGKNVEVYSVGFPQGLGGKVSAEYLKQIKEGKEAYGRLFGEFVKQILEENPDAKVILNGMSLGASMADLAAGKLDETQKQRVSLLLDNPAADHSGDKFLQVPIGFSVESFIRSQIDPRLRASLEAENGVFNKKYKQLLVKQGIDLGEDPAQAELKQQVMLVDILNLSKGIPLDTQNNPLYIRKGVLDPTSLSRYSLARNIIRRFQKKMDMVRRGESLEFGILAGHFINRFRAKKWCRILRNYVK